MVLTLIRATRKTTLNCMSSLSVCLVPNVHCKQSQQPRTICTCVIDYTHKVDTHRRCKELLEQNGRGLMLWLFVGPTGVYLLDFFCSGIQFNLLLSPYPCFISLLYLDLYVLGDDALIS